MHTEVVATAKGFYFETATTAPYVTAPTTPARISDDVYASRSSFVHSTVPFDWEEKPGTPKSRFLFAGAGADDDLDFAFARGGHIRNPGEVSPADELFEEGRIRPLKPPPRLQAMEEWSSVCSSPRSPRVMRGMWSPRRRREREEEVDPFVAAMVEATRDSTESSSSSSRISKGCMVMFERDHLKDACASSNNKRKWKLRDLLLFRSATEGRDKLLKEKEREREKSTRKESNGSTKRGGGEDARKKTTSRSYVQSLFGRLRSGGYSRQFE